MLTVNLVDNTEITFMETIANNPQPFCQFENATRDAANRADMLRFQKLGRHRMRTSRNNGSGGSLHKVLQMKRI